jgi:hypothetical protein
MNRAQEQQSAAFLRGNRLDSRARIDQPAEQQRQGGNGAEDHRLIGGQVVAHAFHDGILHAEASPTEPTAKSAAFRRFCSAVDATAHGSAKRPDCFGQQLDAGLDLLLVNGGECEAEVVERRFRHRQK